MKSARTRKYAILSFRPVAIMILLVLIILVTIFLPPKNALVICMYIVLTGFIGYMVSTYFFPLRIQLVITVGIMIFLVMNAAVGFSFLNSMLLIALIITTSQLTKR
ncbi:MAG: hypothetical protein O3B87_02830 [bacterium]|nr:hypothetical protein [bacterium]